MWPRIGLVSGALHRAVFTGRKFHAVRLHALAAVAPVCAAVLDAVLLRLQRQFSQERAGVSHPVPDAAGLGSADHARGGGIYRAVLFPLWFGGRTRGPLRQSRSGATAQA